MSIAGYNTKITSITIPDPAGDATIPVFKAPAVGATILNAYASMSAAIAANGSNLVTCSLIDGGQDGSGTTQIAVRTGGASVGWDALELHALTVSADSLDGGDQLLFKYDETGTVAPGYVTVVVEWTAGGT